MGRSGQWLRMRCMRAVHHEGHRSPGPHIAGLDAPPFAKPSLGDRLIRIPASIR